MQGVKNFFQGKALGVAEYLIPVLKVCIILFEQVGLIHCKSSATDGDRRFHGDVIRRVTWASGTTGWQKTFGWRAPRVFLLGFMPCLH